MNNALNELYVLQEMHARADRGKAERNRQHLASLVPSQRRWWRKVARTAR